jgi:hypothetical protein
VSVRKWSEQDFLASQGETGQRQVLVSLPSAREKSMFIVSSVEDGRLDFELEGGHSPNKRSLSVR